MPIRYRPDRTPVVEFDPALEISPFTLFRRLKDGPPPLLIDVRSGAGSPRSLRGARPLPDEPWKPPAGRQVVLFDDAGREAPAIARRLQERGHAEVRALFGGLDLYAFALDPEVVGGDTFMVVGPPNPPSR